MIGVYLVGTFSPVITDVVEAVVDVRVTKRPFPAGRATARVAVKSVDARAVVGTFVV